MYLCKGRDGSDLVPGEEVGIEVYWNILEVGTEEERRRICPEVKKKMGEDVDYRAIQYLS